MADNVPITPGSGVNIAAEQMGDGSYVQRVKPTFGAVDTATDVSAATPLPVTQDGTTELNRFENLLIAFRQLLGAAAGQPPDASGRTRALVDSISAGVTLPTVTTVTTVSTVTAVTTVTTVSILSQVKSAGVGAVPLDLATMAQANVAVALQRRQITVS